MTLTDAIGIKIAQLPPERQQTVLDFVEFLASRPPEPAARTDPEGLLAGKVPDLTLDDFKAARREMSRGFPRDFPT